MAMPQVDFSILGDLGKTYKSAQDERMLADLGKGLSAGTLNYKQAAGMAAEAGKLDVGLSLLKLGREADATDQFNKQIGTLFPAQGGQQQAAGPPPMTLANMTQRQPEQPQPEQPVQPPMQAPPVQAPPGPPVRQATEGIISAVTPDGRDLAPGMDAVAAQSRVAQVQQPAAAPQQSPIPQQRNSPVTTPNLFPNTAQNPVTRSIPALLAAVANPGLPQPQREAAKVMLEHAMKSSDLTPDQKEYVGAVAQGETDNYTAWHRKNKTAGATLINTAEGMDAAQTKARIDIDKHAIQDLGQKAVAGRAAAPLLDRVIALADKTPGGWAGSVSPTIARAFSGLGLPVTEGMSNAELLQSISRQFIPAVRDPGSTSNYEQQLYGQSVPGLSQSQEGRVLIAQMLKAQIERNNEIVKIYRQNIGSPDLEKKLTALDAKSIFTPEQVKEMEKVAGKPEPQGTGTPSAEDIAREIQRRGLK